MKWVAHFENIETIRQFDDNDKEVLYQNVLDNIGELNMFCLYRDDGDVYSFDLVDGEFWHNEKLLLKCAPIEDKSMFFYYRKCFLHIGDKYPYVIQCVGFKTDNGKCTLEIDQQTQKYKFSIE